MDALRFDDIKHLLTNGLVEFPIAEINKSIWLKPLSAKQQMAIREMACALKTAEDELAFRKAFFQATIVNELGEYLFNLQNIDCFMDLDARIVNKVYAKLLEFNFPDAKKVEKLAKN